MGDESEIERKRTFERNHTSQLEDCSSSKNRMFVEYFAESL